MAVDRPACGGKVARPRNRPSPRHVHPVPFVMSMLALSCVLPSVRVEDNHADVVSNALAVSGPILLRPREAPRETCSGVSEAGKPPVTAQPAVADSGYRDDVPTARGPSADDRHELNTFSRDGVSAGGQH